MHSDPQTRIADNVAWHMAKELKKAKKMKNVPGDKRIDAKFNEWARRNNINLNDIKLMEKRNGNK